MNISHQPQSDSSGTWKGVPTRFADVGGTKSAYRQLGPDTGVPIIFLNHLAANWTDGTPRVVDGIAASRCVIVYNNRGVGSSEGSMPTRSRQ